jgi:MoxR-like ATPase
MTHLTEKQTELVAALQAGGVTTSPVSRAQICDASESLGKSRSVPSWILHDDSRRAGRGLFHVPEVSGASFEAPAYVAPQEVTPPAEPVAVNQVKTAEAPVTVADSVFALTGGEESLVPSKMGTYVPFGHFKDLERIVKARVFYPTFITGLSGNGKTLMVDQIAAKYKRELYRVNLTCQTDEDDLLGGFRLINGETVWQDGPVVACMKRGGLLLLDEIDLASHAIMCLQPVLEGKGVFLKKIGQWVKPAPGFNVFATANTKGKGDETGRFIATNVLNEAFLDRFPVCVEQEYAPISTEKKIVKKVMDSMDCRDDDFADKLVKWADMIRKVYYEDGVDEIVTTRRLVNCVTAFAIYGDRAKAIEMTTTRFDSVTKEAFLTMYGKVDENTDVSASSETPVEPGEATRWNLSVPFDQKDQAKAVGAKWDNPAKTWFVTPEVYNANSDAFTAWNPVPVMEENATAPF